MRNYFARFTRLTQNRIAIMLCGIIILFSLLSLRLFYLQIIHGEQIQEELTTSVMNNVPQPASRGAIYDRYGRPLAINRVAYSVKIDDSVTLDLGEKRNKLILSLAERYWAMSITPPSNLPISKKQPYTFLFKDKKEEKAWKQLNGISSKKFDMTAKESMDYFSKKFEFPTGLSEAKKRNLLSLHLSLSDKNLMVLSLLNTLEDNGETFANDLPISQDSPYTFQFSDNKSQERSFKESVAMKDKELNDSPAETIEYLRDFFDIPPLFPDATIRKAIGIRYSLYLERYRKYQPVTVALSISPKTLASVEENQDTFPGVIIDTVSLREYPEKEYFSHILGYIRKMSEEDYAEYKEYKDKEGNPLYSISDEVGKSGVEKLHELDLNGVDGEMLVEVDSAGRRMSTIKSKEPTAGNNVFLTLDSQLQKVAYDSLETNLRDILKRKLNTSSKDSVSLKYVFVSMVNCNTISTAKICKSKDGVQKELFGYIKEKSPKLTGGTTEEIAEAKQILIDGVESGVISGQQLILTMIEQGQFSADAEYLEKIKSGYISPLSVINQKLDSLELTPGDVGIEPFSGSVVVSSVHSGETLALVSYPSYDNNELVNTFNNTYYNDMLTDPTTPLVNRPTKEKKAPGSTFKMVSALAGLETGAITTSTSIRDLGSYTKAGKPYAKCWIYGSTGGTHGNVNVSKALEVSCNYFFYETSSRMGNASNGTTINSINSLNEYMDALGLNDYTGLEIGETRPITASPKNKERIIKSYNPEASTSQTRWTDGDTIRAFIGQSVNSYAPVHMNKYIATLANGGTRYKMHLIKKIQDANGHTEKEIQEVTENILEVNPKNLEAIYRGMLQVTSGTKGTLRGVFKDFPIKVAGKSGTAQEKLDKSSHTWFVGFAPYEDPQIAVTVMIPYGEASGSPDAKIGKAVIAEYLGLNYQGENHYMETRLAQ